MTDTTKIAEVAPTSFEEALKSVTPFCAAPFPYTDLQRGWLEDLETAPEELQGTHRLLSVTGLGASNMAGFCCLGRACIVAGAEMKMTWKQSNTISFHYKGTSESSILPTALAVEMQMAPNGEFRPYDVKPGFWGADEKRTITIPGFGQYNGLTYMNDADTGNGEKRLTFRQIAAFIRHDPWRVFAKAPLPETASIEATA